MKKAFNVDFCTPFCVIPWVCAVGQVAPIIRDIHMVGDTLQLLVGGALSTTNQIQSCTNLSQPAWLTSTNLVITENPYWFMDTDAPSASQRFYRVVMLVPRGMALVPAGSFTMGNCMNQSEGMARELPLHSVYASAFYMDQYEVTKVLWDEVKEWNGGNGYGYDWAGSGKAPNHPVQTINWYDCVKWCNARSEKEGLEPCYYADAGLTEVYKAGQVQPYVKWDAKGYRLPTEAEWEKAARGGADGHRFPWSDAETVQHSRANYYSTNTLAYDTSPTRGYHPTFAVGEFPYTSPVGSFAPNGYGLYDMAGNVWEVCWDWFVNTYYTSSPGTDPRGPNSGTHRVTRGGGCGGPLSFDANALRCAMRGGVSQTNAHYDDGFRCVRGL